MTSRDDGPDGRPLLSFVVPVKNEAENIPALVDEIAEAGARIGPFEAIFVDDGSDDATPAVLADLRRARPWLRHLRHGASAGQSAAVRSGVRAARAPIVATLDGDGQNDPGYIPAMYDQLVAAEAGVGLVQGQRERRTDTRFKQLQSRVANGVRGAMLRDGTRDSGCGLKVFRREAYLAAAFFGATHRFLPALIQREGYAVIHHAVTDRPRRHGASHYRTGKRAIQGLVDLVGVWWLIRRMKRPPSVSEVDP